MDGFWSSFSKWFNEKTGSPLYFTYIAFFITWNWKFFQIVFLESPSLFTTPKIEYISSHLPFSTGQWIVLDWILNTSWYIIPPAIFTFLAILYLPILHKWALEKYLNSHFERKELFETRQRKYNEWQLSLEKEKAETLGKIVTVKKRQLKQTAEIKKSTSKEEQWEEEFESIKGSALYIAGMSQLSNIIYNKSGKTRQFNGTDYSLLIGSEILALADSKGLINISGERGTEKIELTEKGRFFMSHYLDSKNRPS